MIYEKPQPENRKMRYPAKAALCFAVCGFLFVLFRYPAQCRSAVLAGVNIAFFQVLPTVFPLMVLSNILLQTDLLDKIGLLFQPYTRALGMRDTGAASVLVLGLLGGFTSLCLGIRTLCEKKQLSPTQAELLLAAGMSIGPAFIILTVGAGFFHSTAIGALAFCSVTVGNLLGALCLRPWAAPGTRELFRGAALPGSRPPLGKIFTDAIQTASDACLHLCGFICFFQLLCTGIQIVLSEKAAGVCSVFLEVTNGTVYLCRARAERSLPYILAALTWSGISVQAQAKALLPAPVTLRLFYLSRLPALLCSQLLWRLLCRLFPVAQTALAPYAVAVSRFSPQIYLSFFLLIAAFLYECTPQRACLSAKKGYNVEEPLHKSPVWERSNMPKVRLFRKDITPSCSYCQHGTLKADGLVVFCLHKGVVSSAHACRHFLYAPTKRQPPRQQKLPDFSDEDFSLEVSATE